MTQIIEHALIVGATGLVGRNLVQQLNCLENCRKITLIQRSPSVPQVLSSKITTRVCEDFLSLSAADLQNYSHVFSALGTTQKKAASKQNFYQIDFKINAHIAQLLQTTATHFILVSAMGANAQSLFFYPRVKGQLEQYVQQLTLAKLSIVRPSLLLGVRNETRILEDYSQKIARYVNKILTHEWVYKPITAEQVAYTMVEVAQTQTKKIEIYDNLSIQKISRGEKK